MSRRTLGSLDLVLAVAVVLTVWLRTPVGELGCRALDLATSGERESTALTAYFDTGPLSLEVIEEDQRAWLPDLPPPPDGGFPEPWRTAARHVLGDELPPAALAVLETLEEAPTEDRAVAALDLLYEGDPQRALERFALDADQRERAVQRARASGSASPTSYETYRRFLPAGELARADESVLHTLEVARELHVVWPAAGDPRVSSVYGMRQHPVYDKLMFHNGIDLAVPVGTPMRSARDGVVVSVGEDDRSGIYVSILHDHGVRTSYCHLDESLVVKGDRVERGEVFARSGNTGGSTGPHLHWTVRIDGKAVDPLPLKPRVMESVEEPAS